MEYAHALIPVLWVSFVNVIRTAVLPTTVRFAAVRLEVLVGAAGCVAAQRIMKMELTVCAPVSNKEQPRLLSSARTLITPTTGCVAGMGGVSVECVTVMMEALWRIGTTKESTARSVRCAIHCISQLTIIIFFLSFFKIVWFF